MLMSTVRFRQKTAAVHPLTATTLFESIVVKAVNENEHAEIRLSDCTNALTTGGGKPGQGYACVLIIYGRQNTCTE